MSKRLGPAVAWAVCAVVAVAIGLLAVSTVGASVSDRGPLGERAQPVDATNVSPLPESEAVRTTIREEFGELDVECRGAVAFATGARPNKATGWDVVSYEPGPDDDVDAVFSNRDRSIEFEVFCLRGQPTLADYETNTLPDDDD